MPWLDLVITGLWGGLCALDRRAFLQAMVSRPLVAATGLGGLLGEPTTGAAVGVVFELFHLGAASFGGAHPHHETLPAVTAAALAVTLQRAAGLGGAPDAACALAVLACAPTGWLGAWLEDRLDERARKYVGRAQDLSHDGQLRRAARQNVRAMWPQFVFYGLLSACAVALGRGLGPLLISAGNAWTASGPLVYRALVLAAGVAALQATQVPHRRLLAAVGALAGLGLGRLSSGVL